MIPIEGDFYLSDDCNTLILKQGETHTHFRIKPRPDNFGWMILTDSTELQPTVYKTIQTFLKAGGANKALVIAREHMRGQG